MSATLELVGVGFALLAPVYGLLFQIQRRIGSFGAELENVKRRVSRTEKAVSQE